MAAIVKQFVKKSTELRWTSKFKDKRLWNLDKQYKWSSQSIDSIASIVWDDDGIGKTVEVALTLYVSELGYDFKVYTAEHFVSATFAADAFENSEHLRHQASTIFPVRNKRPRPPVRRRQTNGGGGASKQSGGDSASTNKRPKNMPTPTIYIMGETSHTLAIPQRTPLKQHFLDKGFFVLMEGQNLGENTDDLDDLDASLRSDILIASLATRAGAVTKDVGYNLRKRMNMVIDMLRHKKPPPPEIQLDLDEMRKVNGQWVVSKNLQEMIASYDFDFNHIYKYYFPEDAYTADMTTLLNLQLYDATMVLLDRSKTYKTQFITIMQDAREDKMVERIRRRASTRRVAVFTGQRHVQKLTRDLSKDYTVQNYTLPSSQFNQILREITLP